MLKTNNKPESQIKSGFFYFVPVLIFIINDIIRDYIRPIYGERKFGIWSIILGWMPNYLAGLGMVMIGIILFRLILDFNEGNNYYRYKYQYISLISVITIIGLTWWEYEQKNGRLIFDLNDIYATICGVLTGYIIFIILIFKGKLKPKDVT
jgi:hypothetical protein